MLIVVLFYPCLGSTQSTFLCNSLHLRVRAWCVCGLALPLLTGLFHSSSFSARQTKTLSVLVKPHPGVSATGETSKHSHYEAGFLAMLRAHDKGPDLGLYPLGGIGQRAVSDPPVLLQYMLHELIREVGHKLASHSGHFRLLNALWVYILCIRQLDVCLGGSFVKSRELLVQRPVIVELEGLLCPVHLHLYALHLHKVHP